LHFLVLLAKIGNKLESWIEKVLNDKKRKGADQHHIREVNRSLILNHIREQKTMSRADLARYMGLSSTAIGHILEELLKEGMIVEEDRQDGHDHRTMLLSFNATAGYIIGGTLGRHHLTLLLTDLLATPIHRLDIPFPTGEGPVKGLSQLVKIIKEFLMQQQVTLSKLLGIGLGIVGTLDPSLQRTTEPTPFVGWAGVHLQQALQEALGVSVYLDNDGNMGALGENRYGAGRSERDMIYVKIGFGIAGGLILNHQLYRGYAGTAGEIGHIPVDFNGTLCHCGRSGCLETIAGARGILMEAQRLSPTITSMTQLIGEAKKGDPSCVHALERAGKYVGFALAALINSLNPALIVLDGSTTQAGELILRPLCSSLETHSLQVPFTHTQVVFAECSSGLAMPLGGVATVLDAAFDKNSSTHLSS
jgi:predicted NBD/HSP70 family sugar kinase/biotin operon repressor